MSNKLGILRKFWAKTKSDLENASTLQPKEKNYFQITFDNHENPENSFTFDVNNPQHIYYVGSNRLKNNDIEDEPETEVIMEPQQRHRKEQNNVDSSSEESFIVGKRNSLVLSQPRVLTWQNKSAFVYKVETKYSIDGQRPDLEFVIYIPIDTAVKWLNSTIQKTPDYISEDSPTDKKADKAVVEESDSDEEIKYGAEENNYGNRRQTIMTWKHEKKSDSLDSEEDEDEKNRKNKITTWKNKESDSDSDEDEKKKKPNKIKEKKVKVPNKKVKKARRVITTYEEDEDEISLGRLRPEESPKKPVKIVAAEDKFY